MKEVDPSKINHVLAITKQILHDRLYLILPMYLDLDLTVPTYIRHSNQALAKELHDHSHLNR